MQKTKVSRERDGARGPNQQPQPVQILNKGCLNSSRFSVWDSFAVFLRLLILGRREQMIAKELVLPNSDAEYELRACGRQKKVYEESESSLNSTQALMRSFRVPDCRMGRQEKERPHHSLARKRVVLRTSIDRQANVVRAGARPSVSSARSAAIQRTTAY